MNEGSHLLMVEDDEDLRACLTVVLEEEGYEVSTAANGKEALDLLRGGGRRPDLILLNEMMPCMDGRQMREELAKDPVLASIPVISLSTLFTKPSE